MKVTRLFSTGMLLKQYEIFLHEKYTEIPSSPERLYSLRSRDFNLDSFIYHCVQICNNFETCIVYDKARWQMRCRSFHRHQSQSTLKNKRSLRVMSAARYSRVLDDIHYHFAGWGQWRRRHEKEKENTVQISAELGTVQHRGRHSRKTAPRQPATKAHETCHVYPVYGRMCPYLYRHTCASSGGAFPGAFPEVFPGSFRGVFLRCFRDQFEKSLLLFSFFFKFLPKSVTSGV